MPSAECIQMKTPSARASAQHIFPPHAATEAESRTSWLSLWKAQIMSRYLSRSRRFSCGMAGDAVFGEDGVLGSDTRRFRI